MVESFYEIIEVVVAAFGVVGQPEVLWVILAAAAYGIFVGSIPGLTATMAVALMVPMTFFLSDVQAIAAIVTTVTTSIFAGDIPATLIRIPGTPASAAYANDAYALTQRGLHHRALAISLTFSVLGGIFGVIVLATLAPVLATFAKQFSSSEYFWLYVLGLSCAATVSGQSTSKACFALVFGMLLSTIGLGADYSLPRLTFGIDQLITGINFIPAMIGLFGVSEIFRNVLYVDQESESVGPSNQEAATGDSTEKSSSLASSFFDSLIRMFASTLSAMAFSLGFSVKRWLSLLRSSSIGSVIGMLPGAGADIAAWISYAISKRFSRNPEAYGSGSEEGLSDATGANNAALGSAWIPALVFGIPGDSVTAIAIGVLLMKNIDPGPEIFNIPENLESVPLVYSLYVAFVIANLMLIPLGILAITTGSFLIRIPRRILLPTILLFCIVGAFAMNGSYFDVLVMLVMGVVGFIFDRYKIPLGPVVLGIILGGDVEHRFIQCLTKSNSIAAFFSSPISIILALACLVLWMGSLGIFKMMKKAN